MIAIPISVTIPVMIAVTITILVAPVGILILIAPALVLIRHGLLGLRTGKGRASNGQSGGNQQHPQSFHKIIPP